MRCGWPAAGMRARSGSTFRRRCCTSSPSAFPPGRPLALDLIVSDETLPLQGKAAGSKRRDDGRYDVKIRLHTLRRDQRARLSTLSWT